MFPNSRLMGLLALSVAFGGTTFAHENDRSHRRMNLQNNTAQQVADFNEGAITAVHNVLFCGEHYLSASNLKEYRSCTSDALDLMNSVLSEQRTGIPRSRQAYLRGMITSLIEMQLTLEWHTPSSPVAAGPFGPEQVEAFQECLIDHDEMDNFCDNQYQDGSSEQNDCYDDADFAKEKCLEQIEWDHGDDEVEGGDEPTE